MTPQRRPLGNEEVGLCQNAREKWEMMFRVYWDQELDVWWYWWCRGPDGWERGFLQKLNSPIQSRSLQPQLRNDDSCLLLLHGVGSSQGLPLKVERNWAQNSSPYIREINKQMGMAGIPWRQLRIPIWSLNLISYNTKQKRRNVKTVPSQAAKNIFSRWGIKKISLMRTNYHQPYLSVLFPFHKA